MATVENNIKTPTQAVAGLEYHYSITRNEIEEIDCLRLEIDNHWTRTTEVISIPLCGIEKAIAQYKADAHAFASRRVRITNDHEKMPVGHFVQVQDALTGEEIKDCARAVITLDPALLNMAELTIYDFENTRSDGPVKTKTMMVENPEIDISAFAHRKKGI